MKDKLDKLVVQVKDKKNLIRCHPRISIAILAVVIIAAGGLTWWLINRTETITSTNPLVASYQEQLPALEAAVAKDGNDAQARYNYAVALYATGDIAKAKDQYEAQAKISQNDPTLENNLGNVYRDLGQYQDAVNAYQKAISLDSKVANPYINLANLYLYTLGQSDLAIKTYQEALNNIPDNQDLEVLLGIAYEQSGDKENAKNTFQQVLNQNPNNVAAAAGLQRVQ